MRSLGTSMGRGWRCAAFPLEIDFGFLLDVTPDFPLGIDLGGCGIRIASTKMEDRRLTFTAS